MEFDPNQSIVIFSHPRSGSTWVQDSLPQFNLSELFTMYCGIKSVDLVSGIRYHYSSTEHTDLDYRFKLFEMFEKEYNAVSVKIHLHLLTEPVINFLKNKSLQYILLKRKNKEDTFFSLLIALTTNEFHNTITVKNITITREIFLEAIDILKKCDETIDTSISNYLSQTIFYEDLIKMSPSKCWKPSSKYVVTNAKSKTHISNIEEVKKWIGDINL